MTDAERMEAAGFAHGPLTEWHEWRRDGGVRISAWDDGSGSLVQIHNRSTGPIVATSYEPRFGPDVDACIAAGVLQMAICRRDSLRAELAEYDAIIAALEVTP